MNVDPIITINGFNLSTTQLTKYTLTYNKLWKNANRNMDGRVTATLIGVYPNISLTTVPIKADIAQRLSAAVNPAYFNVTYWDTQTNSHKTARYYAADHSVEFMNRCTYGEVTIELVAVDKASYIPR